MAQFQRGVSKPNPQERAEALAKYHEFVAKALPPKVVARNRGYQLAAAVAPYSGVSLGAVGGYVAQLAMEGDTILGVVGGRCWVKSYRGFSNAKSRMPHKAFLQRGCEAGCAKI